MSAANRFCDADREAVAEFFADMKVQLELDIEHRGLDRNTARDFYEMARDKIGPFDPWLAHRIVPMSTRELGRSAA